MATTQEPSTKQDILNYLLKQSQASAQELAGALNVSPQAIRRHLKDLESDGLIEHEAIQASMGRPNFVYHLSREGRDRLPDRYDEFALSLLNTLAETVGHDQVGTILRKQWERKAEEYRERLGTGSIAERVANLVKLRQAEGYMAEWYAVDDSESAANSKFIVTEYNCAISHIAESFPSVCGHELEMFAAALQDCIVERTHWLVNGEHRCGYLIQGK
ncbi:iron-sulfur cluster biosynthesis transcriptional regulator SufR [Oculatella sp. FACHB-28]|uniref:iron-sulfur cluster biosynthesis transcriptional regulator SufR n=1 Tax=Cyanophyceae TaxID=3028117 RepID=UPI001688842D|nr:MULTISPECIES: iron-sulfur cluster biosynthesis transcriptional regulator SufR [Cyanophyceae]MBD1868765.1 iron-sulfur cluster biosynthesis transcriptional regulator SufR [Cyanobacteria bacterium FACHB-471]MBD2001585.1 iron-sulfur cluster biosynthesis transcriptional regulator SufR [Leptolyngbya sp. FACHB-541]MBD2057009.1 iron-sulfur cluster biosynthesis transcriptional regulator SufR [Oculatella sp. FACHB-28]MBD2067933.1 iron-sulfur cluster biosynthesis transcriptional regulator SufR [Leptoly